MKTLSVRLTNLTVLLPQSNNCSCYLSKYWCVHRWWQKHTDLPAHDFALTPVLRHQPRFTKVTCSRRWPLCGITPAILTSLLIDSRHHLQWVRSITWQHPSMLVDGNWVNKMESNERSKSRKLIKLVGPSFKGDTGEYQGHFQPVRHQTLKQQTVLNFMYYRKCRIQYEINDWTSCCQVKSCKTLKIIYITKLLWIFYFTAPWVKLF